MPSESTSDPKEERRREILMAALAAFAEKGYDKTTVEDIVRASGLSKGTLYWYFQNKQALFLGLVDMVFDGMWQVFEAALEASRDQSPPERLRRVAVGMAPAIDESINWLGLYADFFNQSWQDGDVRASFRQFYTRFIDAVEPIVQEGIDTGLFREGDTRLIARMLVGALDGYWFQQILELGDASPVMELYAEVIVRGLMKDNANDK